MSLVNYSLPFTGMAAQNWATISPIQQHATAVNNLLYGPAGHQESNLPPDQFYPNEPYAPPRRTTQQFRNRNNNYLPPVPAIQPPQSQSQSQPQHVPLDNQQFHGQPTRSQTRTQFQQTHATRTYGEGIYAKVPPRDIQPPNTQYFSNGDYSNQRRIMFNSQTDTPPTTASRGSSIPADKNSRVKDNPYPSQAPGFKRIHAGQGSRTQVHAILDYDDDEENYDEKDNHSSSRGPDSRDGSMPTVTPIQGPIFIKNGSVPVVPLFSYPTTNNGSFVQIPIWWTALSVALGLEISGEVIHGTPCIKRNNQLYCPTAGNNYPLERIESFIDENKALMRRMYGDFEIFNEYGPPKSFRNQQFAPPGVPDPVAHPGEQPDMAQESEYNGESYFNEWRTKRQTNQSGKSHRAGPSTKPNFGPLPSNESNSGRVDACESKTEIVTPYWAANSAGKIRAIVNTQHFEQAIHQEVCAKMQTSRCGGDCGCEQKYKWHRLLAYDPDNDCKGIFMDWFLFPSCCVCRCTP